MFEVQENCIVRNCLGFASIDVLSLVQFNIDARGAVEGTDQRIAAQMQAYLPTILSLADKQNDRVFAKRMADKFQRHF